MSAGRKMANPTAKSRRLEAFIIAVILAVVASTAVLVEVKFVDIPPGPALQDGSLSKAQEKAIDIALRLSESFITWSIAMIGGIAVLLKLNVENQIAFLRRDVMFASVIIVLAVASIFCGHLGIDLAERGLALQQFPLQIRAVHLSFRFQYLAALSALTLFGAFSVTYFLQKAKA